MLKVTTTQLHLVKINIIIRVLIIISKVVVKREKLNCERFIQVGVMWCVSIFVNNYNLYWKLFYSGQFLHVIVVLVFVCDLVIQKISHNIFCLNSKQIYIITTQLC